MSVPSLAESTLGSLKTIFGSDLMETATTTDFDISARVNINVWAHAAQVAKDDFECDYFSFLSGIDWLTNPNLDGEKTYALEQSQKTSELITDPSIRLAGGSSRFQIMARVANVKSSVAITFFADLNDDLEVPTWTDIYRGADWHEREAWEMYGFNFVGHPNLRHIYLPDGFEGNPLRKDFPLLAREVRPWPGLVDMEEMPAIESEEES